MAQENQVEQYILLMQREKELKAQYTEVKRKREELRDELASEMDAEGVSGYFGSGGEKVSVTHYYRVKVTDHASLTHHLENLGLLNVYQVKRFRIAEDKETGIPGLNNILNEARQVAQQANRPIEEFLPPGLDYYVETGLRITQPKAGNNHSFDKASKSVVELLKEGK